MDMKLSGKTVLITGGSRGIGFACAMAFASEGHGAGKADAAAAAGDQDRFAGEFHVHGRFLSGRTLA